MSRTVLRTISSLFAVATLLAAHAQAQGAQQGSPSSIGKPLVVVNLNSAGVSELAALPGIGEKTAARIVEYRQKNGPFKKVEELLESSSQVRVYRAIGFLKSRRVSLGASENLRK